jgi:sugar/nucleoside kinase (ribokinase family)
MLSIFGMGNPLMDTILSGTEEDLSALHATAGSMNLVTHEIQQQVIRRCSLRLQLPGGSCSNTIRACAWITHNRSAPRIEHTYLGATGCDTAGDTFENMLREQGVKPVLARKDTPTGTSAIVVTPDFERTMFTYLGACRELGVADLDRRQFQGVTLFHTTGYMWDSPNQQAAAETAVSLAREAGSIVSLDIADPFVADRYRVRLREWISGRVDLLFANRQELYSLTGESDDAAAIETASGFAPTVVMKVGAEGCVVHHPAGNTTVPGFTVDAKDTTGAGDAFAGGYLYGVVCGWDPARCARLANWIASEICTVEGCRYDQIDPSWLEGEAG